MAARRIQRRPVQAARKKSATIIPPTAAAPGREAAAGGIEKLHQKLARVVSKTKIVIPSRKTTRARSRVGASLKPDCSARSLTCASWMTKQDGARPRPRRKVASLALAYMVGRLCRHLFAEETNQRRSGECEKRRGKPSATRVGLKPGSDWHKRNFLTEVLIPRFSPSAPAIAPTRFSKCVRAKFVSLGLGTLVPDSTRGDERAD